MMKFSEFGSTGNPTLLVMHGMMQDWRSQYALLRPLEEHYRLIFVAMDGFYDGSSDFTTFADQCRQIEEYVQAHYNGRLHGAYGASQGGLMLTELLTRNQILIDRVIMDGCYVAHQGAIAGWVTYLMFRRFKRTGKFPFLIHGMMLLMGQKLDSMTDAMTKDLYLGASDESIKRNFLQNYTYRARPELAGTSAMVYLWCGSREPYALKSHRELKCWLPRYEETIMDGLGHGQFLLNTPQEACAKIHQTLCA